MKICYEARFLEPVIIDGDWPLHLENGGIFKINKADGMAVAFQIEFHVEPGEIFGNQNGTISITDHRWNEMQSFYARLKSYIQCVAEIDFDPMEIEVHYHAQTDEEKQHIPFEGMFITKGENRKKKAILDHEILGAAVFGSIKADNQTPFFVGELKNLSRRSAREERYVDAFRYDFLIIEALYGKGQFKSAQLARSLKSARSLLSALETAREGAKWTIEEVVDDTQDAICSNSTTEELIDHLVKKRGYYFHGNPAMLRQVNWTSEEGKTLCILLGLATDAILRENTGNLYELEAWERYEECAKLQGMTTKLEVQYQLAHKNSKQSQNIGTQELAVGEPRSSRTRIKWALSTLANLDYDEEILDLKSVVGKDLLSDVELFRIAIPLMEYRLKKQGMVTQADTMTYVVQYEFSEEVETRDYLITAKRGKEHNFMSNATMKWLVGLAMRASFDYSHERLVRVSCRVENTDIELFEVVVGTKPEVG